MEHPDLAKLHLALEVEVRHMRHQQQLFFKGDRSAERVRLAKERERAVDRILKDIDSIRNPPPQGRLF